MALTMKWSLSTQWSNMSTCSEGLSSTSPFFSSLREIFVQMFCMLYVVWPPPLVLNLQAMDTMPEQS